MSTSSPPTPSASVPGTYHHGNLPETLLAATAALVQERGPAGVSLREVARRAGVSHSAPAHHFGDKAGLLHALAREGFERFGDALVTADRRFAAAPPQDRCLEVGVAYVRFAADNPAHFAVMWRTDLQDCDDVALLEASARAYEILEGTVRAMQAEGWAPDVDVATGARYVWSNVHGLASLWNDGVFRDLAPGADELEQLARHTLALAFPRPR